MKRIVWLFLLALALPMAAFASNSTDFSNFGGTLSGSSAGLSLSGSALIAVNGITGNLPLGLGTVAFSTGSVASGSLQMGGTLNSSGSSFVITGNGMNGVHNGVIFTGSFSGPVVWTLVTLADGTHNYTLMGALKGTWYTNAPVVGATVQVTLNTGKGFFSSGTTMISSGNTNINTVVPEPSSLTLLGTGLVGLAGVVRRKLKA